MSDRKRDENEQAKAKFFENLYKCCAKPCKALVCRVCNSVFHESCSKRLKNIRTVDQGTVECCDPGECETIQSKDEIKILQTEIYYLKMLLEETQDKNKVLQLNNELLLEKLDEVNVKIQKITTSKTCEADKVPMSSTGVEKKKSGISNKSKNKQAFTKNRIKNG